MISCPRSVRSASNNGLSPTTIGRLAIDPVTPATIYATSPLEGVYRSTDAGASWGAYNAGLNPITSIPIAVDPATPTMVYTGTFGGGVLRTN
jgi:hypothetical protein